MKTHFYIIILLVLTSCSKTTITYQGVWTGNGFAIDHKNQNIDNADNKEHKINYDKIKLTITNDTFEIFGLDKNFRGVIDANHDTTTIDLLDFDSYEYETLRKKDELKRSGTITVQVSGGQPLTGEAIWINDDKSITLTFYRNRYEENSRYYELKLKKTDG